MAVKRMAKIVRFSEKFVRVKMSSQIPIKTTLKIIEKRLIYLALDLNPSVRLIRLIFEPKTSERIFINWSIYIHSMFLCIRTDSFSISEFYKISNLV